MRQFGALSLSPAPFARPETLATLLPGRTDGAIALLRVTLCPLTWDIARYPRLCSIGMVTRYVKESHAWTFSGKEDRISQGADFWSPPLSQTDVFFPDEGKTKIS